jgi:hypothetical protein
MKCVHDACLIAGSGVGSGVSNGVEHCPQKTKDLEYRYSRSLIFGRCERIRTFDPLHPMQVRYQAAPHTDLALKYTTVPPQNACDGQ